MAAILAGQTLVVDRQGTKVDAGQYLADKVVALYVTFNFQYRYLSPSPQKKSQWKS